MPCKQTKSRTKYIRMTAWPENGREERGNFIHLNFVRSHFRCSQQSRLTASDVSLSETLRLPSCRKRASRSEESRGLPSLRGLPPFRRAKEGCERPFMMRQYDKRGFKMESRNMRSSILKCRPSPRASNLPEPRTFRNIFVFFIVIP